MDDLLGLEEDITEKRLSKFKPKAHANPVKVAAKPLSKTSNDSTLASYRLSVQEPNNQPNKLVSEAVPPNNEKQTYAGEDADMSFNLDSSSVRLGDSSTNDIGSSPLGSFSEAADNYFKQMSDGNPEGLFHFLSPSSDPNRDLQDTSEGPFGNVVSLSTSAEEGIIFPAVSKEHADLAEEENTTSRADCQASDELEQQVEERPAHETVEVVKSRKLSQKVRKSMNKSCTNMEDASDHEWNVENSEILEMDDDPSDTEYQDEEMSKKKRCHKKPKKQISETKKQKKRCKKVSNESDSTQKEQPKKKFPHATQRRRRQVDKAILQTPEDEINVRRLAIKDLIMLAEAKEKILSKTAAALGKSFSNVSQGSKHSYNEDDDWGEEEEGNHNDDEASERSQATQKKLNYQSYINKSPGVRWSKSEINLLYQAIRQFGTDFAMIQQLFPNRTRHQVKLKFKNEERKHPLQIQDALLHRCNDNAHFKQVIEQLNIKPKETSTQDAYGDIETNLQDPKVESSKKDAGEHHKDDAEGREDQGPDLMNVDKDEPNNSENLNGLGLFDWDADDYSEGMEEYES